MKVYVVWNADIEPGIVAIYATRAAAEAHAQQKSYVFCVEEWDVLDECTVERVVIVKQEPEGGYVEEVNPRTRTVTGVPQQFREGANGSLTVLPRSEWVTYPEVVVVSGARFG